MVLLLGVSLVGHYLDGPVHIRGLEPQVDQAADGQADEQPVVEAEVVDELEDVAHAQVEQSHGALIEGKMTTRQQGREGQ